MKKEYDLLKEGNYKKFLPFNEFNTKDNYHFINHIKSENIDNYMFFM